MKRTAELGKVGNNLPRTKHEGRKKKLNPKRPQDQGTALNRARSRQ